MKYFGLVWKNLWRKKIRTSLTILSVLVAFMLFFLLNAIGQALTGGGATIESASRLVVNSNPIRELSFARRKQALGAVRRGRRASRAAG